ncbi:hypothetical protein [Mesorhizobium amorphae]|uniref:hypothetical protein n=1 Tax=Mesorhizobium amorphae TaxID=71433 RepID=UPI0011863CA6|nr:hypothetical protein [Mesorhizobium amorphae]
MNLHGIVAPAIGVVNPFVVTTIKRSNGATTLPDGKRVPSYDTFGNVKVQVQAFTADDLKQLDGLNIQGTKRAVYLNGPIAGVIRDAQAGGDLMVFPNGTLSEGNTWLVAHVLERWPDWSKCVITLQNGA